MARQLIVSKGEIVIGTRVVGLKFHHRLVGARRFIISAETQIRVSQSTQRLGPISLKFDRLVQSGGGRLILLRRVVSDAEIEIAFGVIRLRVNRLLESIDGILTLPLREVGSAEVVVGQRVIWF